MGRGMAGGGGRAVGAVAVPCEVTAMVCGAAVGVVSSVKAWCSELCVGTTGFGGQFDPEDVLLPLPDPYTNRHGIKFATRRNSQTRGESYF